MPDTTAEELPLAGHSSPTEGTEFSGRVVEGADLSRLLSAFQPPLPTDERKPLLVGLGGFKQSGKDTVAKHWAESPEKNFARLMMSDPVREAGEILNPWIKLDRAVVIRAGEEPVQFFKTGEHVRLNVLTAGLGYDASKEFPEVRYFYQRLGTEVGRLLVGEDVWADIALQRINSLRDAGVAVAITGIRFRNELDMLHRLGGHAVWVDRPGLESDGHASESSLSKEDFDFVLDNNGSLEQLYRRADHLLTLVG